MKIIAIAVFLNLSGALLADEAYHYSVNLTKVMNDKVQVTLIPPDFKEEEVIFAFPAMVPGTYEVYDFGRYISNLKVFGKNGETISLVKMDVNTYKFSPASKIDKITYDVDDTFDKCDLPKTKDKIIFEPGGTNFEADKNYSLNTHSMFGYFKGFTAKSFILEFEKPKNFYPATGLSDIRIGEQKDIITATSYHHLVDSPIIYALPDTANIMVANTQVLVSCYSPNNKINARFIASTLKELLYAQRDYLGGELPVKKYAFLFYFMAGPSQSGASGALEHSYSSFYVLPEFDSLSMQQELRDVAAHEFFHIVTPLNIHSKEIGEFDFNDPKMSEHLWLYEGMTEYAAHHAQAKGMITDADQLINTMMQKYTNSIKEYNDTMSFTYMSKHVLEEKIHTQYANVYEKGAVIGMCLDILLRDLSDGKYGTQNLMKDLATKYGADRSFDDKDLFNDITAFTYPEVGQFLKNHVGGNTPLPMESILQRVGIEFVKEKVTFEFSLGGPDLDFNETTGRLFVESTDHLDEFGKALGFKKGDEWGRLNGKELKMENIKEIISDYYQNISVGDVVSLEIYRPKRRKGKYKQMTLTAKAQKVRITRENQIDLVKNMTDKQKNTLKSWAGL